MHALYSLCQGGIGKAEPANGCVEAYQTSPFQLIISLNRCLSSRSRGTLSSFTILIEDARGYFKNCAFVKKVSPVNGKGKKSWFSTQKGVHSFSWVYKVYALVSHAFAVIHICSFTGLPFLSSHGRRNWVRVISAFTLSLKTSLLLVRPHSPHFGMPTACIPLSCLPGTTMYKPLSLKIVGLKSFSSETVYCRNMPFE